MTEPTDTEPTDTGLEAVLAHPAVVRVREALAAHQIMAEVQVLGGSARTAAQAAAHLGVSPAQIANSLLFAARTLPHSHPEPLLVLTSGAHRVDTVKIADLLELAEVTQADPDLVRRSTGFVIGGVAPVGLRHPVRTLVDVSLARYDTVWAAAGHPRAVFPTSYDELLRMTGGQPIEVT